MKKIFPVVLLMAGTTAAVAQKCNNFYYFKNNKTIEITITNKKGKEVGKNVYFISEVHNKGNDLTSTVISEFKDPKGKTVSKATNTIHCSGGIMKMDLKMFIPSAQQEQMGTISSADAEGYLEYPASIQEGDELKDGQFSMDYKGSTGLAGHVSVNITNRKVTGKESVTTPAGTWECFKITYHSKVAIKMIVNIPFNSDVTEWYAPGFGIVKTESKSGTTEITAIH
jgi:hypothetical protein